MKKLIIGEEENLEGRWFKEKYNSLTPGQAAIIESIEMLQCSLEGTIKSLNSGGCGIFAYHMSTRLKQIGIPHKILVSDHGAHGSWEFLNMEFKNGNNGWLSASHVFIEVFGLMFDGYGWLAETECGVVRRIYPYEPVSEWERGDFDEMVGEFDYILLRKAALETNVGWNSMYDRRQNDMLENLIYKF